MVRDVHNDIKTVSLNTEGTNVEITMNPVLDRIAQGKDMLYFIVTENCASFYMRQFMSIKYFQLDEGLSTQLAAPHTHQTQLRVPDNLKISWNLDTSTFML